MCVIVVILSLLSRLIIPHITSKHADFTIATVCKRYAFETENGTRTAAKKIWDLL